VAIAFVQSRSVDGGSVTSATLAYNSNVTAGSLLPHAVRIGANGRTITVTDDKSNTYNNAWSVLNDGQGNDIQVPYAMNAAAGATTVQVAISGAAATIRFAIHEYSGIATTSALDQQTRQTYAASSSPDSGNVTITQADELLFGYVDNGTRSVATAFTQGASYNKREQLVVGTTLAIGTEDRIVAATGTYSAPFSLTGGAESGGVGIATFKGAGGAVAITYPQLERLTRGAMRGMPGRV
jgi:hypothetical protein